MKIKADPLTHGIKNCRCSAGFKVFTSIKVQCSLIRKCFEIGNFSYHQTLCTSVERQCVNRKFAAKRQKKKNDIMNSRPTKLHICKPRHTSRCFSLQKSSFLANAPMEIGTFAFINNDFKTGLNNV